IRLTTKQGKDFPLDKREIPTPLETLPVVNNKQEPFRHMLNGAKIVSPGHDASDGYYDHNNGYSFGQDMLHLSGKEKDALKSLGPFTYSAIAYFSFIKYESLARLPLKSNASAQIGVNTVKILNGRSADHGYRLELKINILNLFLAGLIEKKEFLIHEGQKWGRGFRWGFALHNPVTKEALLPVKTDLLHFIVYPFEIRNADILFHRPGGV
ncbi:MAG: hypothetical protein GY757_62080, partial [bacterium]|nr:hypothetical protein [bacterium]